MQERNALFNLDRAEFTDILREKNWFKLQREFEGEENPLSQSFLIWKIESNIHCLLADFGNHKAYYLQREYDETGNSVLQVSEISDQDQHPLDLKSNELIFTYLKPYPRTDGEPQGTDEGFIDLLQKIDLDEFDLDSLKRRDLSGAGFSFEAIHQDLLIVHGMFRDVLTSPRESLLKLSNGRAKDVGTRLQEFDENLKAIRDFEISSENPLETHTNLLKVISDLCSDLKDSLSQTIAYLKSQQIEKLESQIKSTVDPIVENLSNEGNRAKEINNEAERSETERQQEFDRLKLQVENFLGEKPVSQYKEIFAEQAKRHKTASWIWLFVTGLLTLGFGVIFRELFISLESSGNNLAQILPNLVTKGFFLSLAYLLLNRSIKNYTAEKHLQTVNRHRQNALETFDVFLAASGDNRETRDAVLLAATDAIFDANQSGYLSMKTSRSDNAGTIQQLLRTLISGRPAAGGD